MARKKDDKEYGVLFVKEKDVIEMLVDMCIDVDALKKEGKLQDIVDKIVDTVTKGIKVSRFADVSFPQIVSRATESVASDEGLASDDECDDQ